MEYTKQLFFSTFDGNTALHYLSKCGETESAMLLIQRKINVQSQNFVGKTGLHIAAKYGWYETVKLLVDNKADVNAQDIHGNTPLRHAAKEVQLKCMEKLLGSQADVNLRNKMGQIPLQVLLSSHKAYLRNDKQKRYEICQLLVQKGELRHF